MSIGLMGTKSSDLEEAKNLLKRAAKGEVPGIEFGNIELEDISKAASTLQEANDEAKKDISGPGLSAVCYAGSVDRDIVYAIAGRKYMRAASLNSRQLILYRRALALGFIEDARKQK